MPADLGGLIVFLAAVSPGYVYLRIAEARKPRPTRATLILTVEIFLIGSAFTSLAGLAVTTVMQSKFDLIEGLLGESDAYFREHYALVTASLMLTVLLGHGAAAGTALVVYRKAPTGYSPGGSVWTLFVSVHLTDTRVISGYVLGFDLDAENAERDLALLAPIFLTMLGRAPVRQGDLQRLIVGGDMIREIGVRYEDARSVLAS